MTKIAIIYYSMYGHIATMAEAVKKGVEAGGATCDIYQVAETLPAEVLEKMYGTFNSVCCYESPSLYARMCVCVCVCIDGSQSAVYCLPSSFLPISPVRVFVVLPTQPYLPIQLPPRRTTPSWTLPRWQITMDSSLGFRAGSERFPLK